MKKILFIGQLPKDVGGSYTTGVAKVVFELSKQKVEGFQFFTYSTNIKDESARALCSYKYQYMGYTYPILRIAKNLLSHPLDTFRQWKIYRKKLNKNPLRFEFYKANFQDAIDKAMPDLIHMHADGLTPLYFANEDYKIPIVYTCHGVFERYVDPEAPARLYADYLTGLTPETLYEIHNYYCCNDDTKIRIIPNGVDCSKFYFSLEDRIKVRKEMNVDNNTIVFVTVASVQERKGQFSFIKLIKDLPINYQYWIIGLGPDIELIEKYCREYNLSDRIKILGYKNSDELYKYYSAADIYAHASTMEGQALCEIEAFATGLRVLVRDLIKGTIVDDELNSGDYLFVDFDNPKLDIIKEWVISAPDTSRHSRNNLDWSEVAKKYTNYYNDILNNELL